VVDRQRRALIGISVEAQRSSRVDKQATGIGCRTIAKTYGAFLHAIRVTSRSPSASVHILSDERRA
jgi:hypothetical protein